MENGEECFASRHLLTPSSPCHLSLFRLFVGSRVSVLIRHSARSWLSFGDYYIHPAYLCIWHSSIVFSFSFLELLCDACFWLPCQVSAGNDSLLVHVVSAIWAHPASLSVCFCSALYHSGSTHMLLWAWASAVQHSFVRFRHRHTHCHISVPQNVMR